MARINKRTPGVCPNCGHVEKQIVDSNYPRFDKYTDTVEKHYICERCLIEWYEDYKIEYTGCEVFELTDDGYAHLKYDKEGNKV